MSLNPTVGPVLQECKCCTAAVNPSHELCPVCNFPLKATEKEQNDFIYQRDYKQLELGELKTKSNKAATTFYFIAGIMLLWGIVGFFRDATSDNSVYIIGIYGFLSVLYLCLGFWSKNKPVTAIITGLVLYILLTILDFIAEPLSIGRGLLVRVLIIAGLIKALKSALEAKKIKEEYRI